MDAKILLEDTAAKLKLIAKEMGQLPESGRRDKLTRELKDLAEDIHQYKIDYMQRQKTE